jgi:uncharacterized protein YkwD
VPIPWTAVSTLSRATTTTRRHVGALLAVALVVCLGGLGAGVAIANKTAPRSCRGANLRPGAANRAAVDAAMLCLLNQTRAAYHLRPLRGNRVLGTVATSQADDMVRRNFFSDIRPSGQTPHALIAATRYPLRGAGLATGQNIGWGTGLYASARSMLAAWMASPSHRAIILTRNFRDAGVAVDPALPPLLGAGRAGATYAIELAAR